jgi:hypothetical protein
MTKHAIRHQILISPRMRHFPTLDYNHPVRLPDCFKPMCNHYPCAGQSLQCSHGRRLSGAIKGARRLIKNQNVRARDQGSRKKQALNLPP